MVDQMLAQHAKHKAKENQISLVPETLEKTEKEGKIRTEMIKQKAKELLGAINPINWLKERETAKQENLRLSTELQFTLERIEKATAHIKGNISYLDEGSKIKKLCGDAVKGVETIWKSNKKLIEEVNKVEKDLHDFYFTPVKNYGKQIKTAS